MFYASIDHSGGKNEDISQLGGKISVQFCATLDQLMIGRHPCQLQGFSTHQPDINTSH